MWFTKAWLTDALAGTPTYFTSLDVACRTVGAVLDGSRTRAGFRSRQIFRLFLHFIDAILPQHLDCENMARNRDRYEK